MKLRRWPRAATHAARSIGVETAHTPLNSPAAVSPSSPASLRVTFPPSENPTTKIGRGLARRIASFDRRPIAAAKNFGAKAVGIEYDTDLAAFARRNAERAGVSDKVTIITGDIFKEDFSAATVVTLYLLPDLNQQLRPQLLRMKPGTRVVSHLWDMGEWEPDETLRDGDSEAFVWIVPAQVGGRWTISDAQNRWDGVLDIMQQFQRIGGTLTIRGAAQPLLGAYVHGALLGFTFVALDGGVRSVRVRVDGGAFSGSLQFSGHLTPIAGARTAN